MKTKLLLSCLMFLLFVVGYVQSQSQQWAVTLNGGQYGEGAIIHANSNGTGFTVAHSFQSPDGYHPYGNLLLASDGNLYGTCFDGGAFASCTCYRFDPSTGTYTDVYDFDIVHGDFPRSGMVEGPNGFIYGAASSGGANSGGVIYSLNINTGTYYDLVDLSYATGGHPIGNPVFHSNGKLYGLASIGGTFIHGVIYSYDILTDTYSDLYDFDGATGADPNGSLLEVNGILYGMTMNGGSNDMGVIFSLDATSNVFTKLVDFDGTNGAKPKGSLMLASNGLLYGMTSYGGSQGQGALFSFNTSNNAVTNLFSFSSADGSTPEGSLSGNGNVLCGSTYDGGANGLGVMFNFDIMTNTYTKVLDFNNTNGANPTGGFITVTTTGIASATSENISVFPNPASNDLYVTMQYRQPVNATFTLRDMLGKVVYASEEGMGTDQTKTINLTGISRGSYLLEIRTEKEKIIKKVVKN